MELDLGLIRTESDVLTNVQRRSYTNLPTIISAAVNIPVNQLYDFTMWLNSNIGLWVDLPLAHPFMVRDRKVETVPARIVNFSLPNSYQVHGNVLGTVTIQLSPTVFIDNANDTDPFDWIVAGRVPTPSSDWLIARTAINPAPNWTISSPIPGGP